MFSLQFYCNRLERSISYLGIIINLINENRILKTNFVTQR